MLTVISPAKKLDMSATDVAPTLPEFQDDANVLAASAAKLSAKKLGALMSISDNLAKLNYDRFKPTIPNPQHLALRATPIPGWKQAPSTRMKWPTRKTICASCRGSTDCSNPATRSSLTGLKWAAA